MRYAVSNLPQIQFNDDSVWHDFAPEGGTALKVGPWFPYLELKEDDLVSDHRVDPTVPWGHQERRHEAQACINFS